MPARRKGIPEEASEEPSVFAAWKLSLKPVVEIPKLVSSYLAGLPAVVVIPVEEIL
jgi:hypothetical protein